MDHADRLLHRAYVLVESEVAAADAIEDLVTLAHGNVEHLRLARSRTVAGPESDAGTLEMAGFEADLGEMAVRRHRDLDDLLDRAIASFS